MIPIFPVKLLATNKRSNLSVAFGRRSRDGLCKHIRNVKQRVQ
jgi:hypothetical protein